MSNDKPASGCALSQWGGALVTIVFTYALLMILFPVPHKSREKARQTECLSQMKQLSLAFQQYVDNNDNRLPGAVSGPVSRPYPTGGWIYYTAFPANGTPKSIDVTKGSLYPYVKTTQVYVCPDDAQGKQSGDSYAMGACLTGVKVGRVHPGKPMLAFADTNKWLLLAEEAASPSGSPVDPDADSTDDGYFMYPGDTLSTRHSGGSNVVMLDGHAKWYRPGHALAENLFSGGAAGGVCR